MLFVIGLITSVHCIAMCGGINLSQCIPKSGQTVSNSRFSTFRPTFLYNLGRVISYTAVGFIVGALGSAITFSNSAQGVLKLIAGVFMVIIGINMLGIFPWLRRLNPRMPKFFVRKINPEKSGSNSPLTVGAVRVVVLGLSMLTQGWSLSGFSLPSNTAASPNDAASGADGIAVENGVQVVNSTLLSNKYPNITVQAGLDTPWVINHSSSNFSLLVPVYSTELDLQSGANPVFLSPEESFDFSNGNSKFFGYVKVVDDLSAIDPDSIKEETTGFKTMIYPSDTFQSNGGGGGGCCG